MKPDLSEMKDLFSRLNIKYELLNRDAVIHTDDKKRKELEVAYTIMINGGNFCNGYFYFDKDGKFLAYTVIG